MIGAGALSRGGTMHTLLRALVPVAALAAGFGAMAALGGCGAKAPDPASAARVRGRLTFNGAPVAGALVVFAPDPRRGAPGPVARAATAADGSFALPAVAPGWYRVALAAPPGATATPFPPKLARPDLSGIEREVRAGHEHAFDIAVDAPVP